MSRGCGSLEMYLEPGGEAVEGALDGSVTHEPRE